MTMNDKDKKRHFAYEALVILGLLALLNYICRLWPILLLIILGIFIAALRLLFLSSTQVEVMKPLPLLPAPLPELTEKEMKALAYSLILNRITAIVLSEYPKARWVWEVSDAYRRIELGETVYILLNKAGGYRRAQVIIQNLQVIGIQYQKMQSEMAEEVEEDASEEPPKENFELLAFEWTEAHIFDLNARCNDAIGRGLTELIIEADELPTKESWPDVCRELIRADLENVECIPNGIKINLPH